MYISKFRDEKLENPFSRLPIFEFFTYQEENKPKFKRSALLERNYNYKDKLIEIAYDLKKEKENFEKLVTNFENLSDIDFFELYKSFYDWNITEIKKVYFKDFFGSPKTFVLKTDDITSVQRTEGHGRDFSYWNEWFYSAWEVIADANTVFEDRVYSVQELARLINQNKIIVNLKGIPYGEELSDEQVEKAKEILSKIDIKSLELDYSFTTYPSYIKKEDIERMFKNNAPAFKRIREEFTPEILKADYKKYLKAYKFTIKQMIERIKQLNEKDLQKLNEQKEDIENTDNFVNDFSKNDGKNF